MLTFWESDDVDFRVSDIFFQNVSLFLQKFSEMFENVISTLKYIVVSLAETTCENTGFPPQTG